MSSHRPAYGATATIVTSTPGPGDHERAALASVETREKPIRSARNSNDRTSVGLATDLRTSPHTSRLATTSARRRVRVAQIRIGIPIRSAYQRFGLSAAFAIEFETRPSKPSDRAASSGEPDDASAAIPSPATTTSVSGKSQMKRRYASAAEMMPPPTSASRSTMA